MKKDLARNEETVLGSDVKGSALEVILNGDEVERTGEEGLGEVGGGRGGR